MMMPYERRQAAADAIRRLCPRSTAAAKQANRTETGGHSKTKRDDSDKAEPTAIRRSKETKNVAGNKSARKCGDLRTSGSSRVESSESSSSVILASASDKRGPGRPRKIDEVRNCADHCQSGKSKIISSSSSSSSSSSISISSKGIHRKRHSHSSRNSTRSRDPNSTSSVIRKASSHLKKEPESILILKKRKLVKKEHKHFGKHRKRRKIVKSEPNDSNSICEMDNPPKEVPNNVHSQEGLDRNEVKPYEKKGSVVWARLAGHKWWPAVIINGKDVGHKEARPNFSWVFWYGDHKTSQVPISRIKWFATNFNGCFSLCGNSLYKKGVVEALKGIAKRFNKSSEIAESGKSNENIKSFAEHLFKKIGVKKIDFPAELTSPCIKENVKRISDSEKSPKKSSAVSVNSANESSLQNDDGEIISDVDMPESVPNKSLKSEPDKSLKSEDEHQQKCPGTLFNEIRSGRKSIETVCLACRDASREVEIKHPLLIGGLCSRCKGAFMNIIFCYGNDGCNSYCLICLNGGDLFVCDSQGCGKSFCVSCVETLAGSPAFEYCRDSSPWHCLLCREWPEKLYTPNNLLRGRPDWRKNVIQLFVKPESVLHRSAFASDSFTKRRLRVLSLFDGICTGKVVLDNLNLDLEAYYASEIDEASMVVTNAYHGLSVTQLGDVRNISAAKLAEIGPIDLLIGGSPCNDLSLVNPARKGIYDGTGVLFFEFYRILLLLIASQPDHHVFWLFENVVNMKLETKETITRFLECEPMVFNAAHVSAQNRARNFWGNIPGLYSPLDPSVRSRANEITLQSILTPGLGRTATVDKVRCVTTKINSVLDQLGKQKSTNIMPVVMNGRFDTMWITEIEAAFGLPRHYTDVNNMGTNLRHMLLGRAWCVPVVQCLLAPLKQFFRLKNESASNTPPDGHLVDSSDSSRVTRSENNVVIDSLECHDEKPAYIL